MRFIEEQTTGISTPATGRNYNLDLLKIVACVAVVGLHTLQKDLSIFNSTLYYCCGFAVPVFFMCSGFMLLSRKNVTFSYVIKKIVSILRVVLLWSLIIHAAKISLDIFKGQFDTSSLLSFPIIAAKSLLQKGTLWQFWYLGALMILYVLLFVLQKLSFQHKLQFVWAICLITGFVFQIVSYVCGEPIQKHFIQTFRLWTWVQYFTLGGLLAERNMIQQKINVHTHAIILFSLTAVVLVYQNFMGRFVLHNMYAEYFYDDILTILLVVVLFTFVMRLELSTMSVSVIKQLAPITMGIYIVHPLFRAVGNAVFSITTIPASLLYFAGILVLSTAVCFIMKRVPGVKRLIEI